MISWNKNYKIFYLFVIIGSSVIFFLNFYFRDYLIAGSKSDFNTFVFNNIQIFKLDFSSSIRDYSNLGDANWPLLYVFHAYLNPFSSNPEHYLITTSLIGFTTFIILSISFKNKNFNNFESFALASLILLLPWFNGRAHWGTSANLGWFFFSISVYLFIKLENNFQNSNKRKIILLFLFCLLSSLSLYSRLSLSFFCLFFTLNYYLSEETKKNKFFITLFYILFSIPGVMLIYTWGGLLDYSNSNHNPDDHNYKNIFKNIPIILNYFFFYLWPIFFIEFLDKGFKKILKDHYQACIFFIFVFFILFFNNVLDYLSNYSYGGGVILKFGYLIGDKHNLIFSITSILGGSIVYNFIRENFKHNFLLFICIFFIYGHSIRLFQDYLEPLIFILFFSGLIKSDKFILVKKKFNLVLIMYFIYFMIYNCSTIIYKQYF